MSLLFFIFILFFLFTKNARAFFFACEVKLCFRARFSSLHQATWALLCGTRAHYDDRRTLEVPGCSSALCLGFSCCRGRARPVSSGAALQVRLSAACSRVAFVSQSRHRAGDVARRRRAGSPQLRLSISRAAKEQGSQLGRSPAAAFGAARRACQREEPAVRCFFGRTKSGSSFLQKIM